MSASAFPHGSQTVQCPNCNWDVQTYQPGMTLRDWFAGQALNGFASICTGKDWDWFTGQAAEQAYKAADAMLAERARSTMEGLS